MPHSHHQHHHSSQREARGSVASGHGTDDAHREPVYPEALHSGLETKFTGPVLGTVVIGRDLPDDIDDESVFDLVSPAGTILNRSHVAAQGMLKNIADSLNRMAAMPSHQSGGQVSLPSRSGRTPASSPSVTPEPVSVPSEKHILEEGGFVVFSDLYVASHPASPIAAITHDYARVHHADPETPFEVDPSLKEDKQRVEKIKHLLKEADAQHRPLFRRRPSSLRYGTARYIPAEPSATPTSTEASRTLRTCDGGIDGQGAVEAFNAFDEALMGCTSTAADHGEPGNPTLDFPLPQMTTRKPSRITCVDTVVAAVVQ